MTAGHWEKPGNIPKLSWKYFASSCDSQNWAEKTMQVPNERCIHFPRNKNLQGYPIGNWATQLKNMHKSNWFMKPQCFQGKQKQNLWNHHLLYSSHLFAVTDRILSCRGNEKKTSLHDPPTREVGGSLWRFGEEVGNRVNNTLSPNISGT